MDPTNSQATLIRALNSVYEISGGDVNNGDPRDKTRDELYKKGIVTFIINILDILPTNENCSVIKICCKVLRNLARNDIINESFGKEYNLCIRILSLFDNQLNPTDIGNIIIYLLLYYH